MPDSFGKLTLDEQAASVDRCHKQDLLAWARCAAHQQELAEWVEHRIVDQVKK